MTYPIRKRDGFITEGPDSTEHIKRPSKQATHTPGQHESRLCCAGCRKAEGWCCCPDGCDCLSCLNTELLEALKALYSDSREFHDTPDAEELRSGSHTNCGWCMAKAAIARAEGKEQAR